MSHPTPRVSLSVFWRLVRAQIEDPSVALRFACGGDSDKRVALLVTPAQSAAGYRVLLEGYGATEDDACAALCDKLKAKLYAERDQLDARCREIEYLEAQERRENDS